MRKSCSYHLIVFLTVYPTLFAYKHVKVSSMLASCASLRPFFLLAFFLHQQAFIVAYYSLPLNWHFYANICYLFSCSFFLTVYVYSFYHFAWDLSLSPLLVCLCVYSPVVLSLSSPLSFSLPLYLSLLSIC